MYIDLLHLHQPLHPLLFNTTPPYHVLWADFDNSGSVNSGTPGGEGWNNRRSNVNSHDRNTAGNDNDRFYGSSSDSRGRQHHHPPPPGGHGRNHKSRSRSFDSGRGRGGGGNDQDDRYSYYTNHPKDDNHGDNKTHRGRSRDGTMAVTSRGHRSYYGRDNQDHTDRYPPSNQQYRNENGGLGPRNISSSRDSSDRNNRWPKEGGNDRSRFRNSNKEDGDWDNGDNDEDGFAEQQHRPSSKDVVEWPPSFDTDGSSYVFDVRSAMFYEALSDFFYDPKSKLYYGNRTGTYFRYDETHDPPFVKVEAGTETSTTSNPAMLEGCTNEGGLDQVIMMPSTSKKVDMLPKIAIKLKTKKIKSKSTNLESTSEGGNAATLPVTASTSVVSKAQKEQIANIEKWTGKQAELNEGTTASATSAAPAGTVEGDSATTMGRLQPQQQQQQLNKVRTTAKGEPMCVICKRKFPTIEKLRLHEKASDLHKKNLLILQQQQQQRAAKRKVDELDPNDESGSSTAAVGTVSGESSRNNTTTVTAASTTQYQDRAEKRRQLHGPDSSIAIAGARIFGGLPPSIAGHGSGGSGGIEEETASLDPLDQTNIGHKMMQKMGYSNIKDSEKDDVNDPLRREWDRIEALASHHKHGPRGGGGNGNYYGPK